MVRGESVSYVRFVCVVCGPCAFVRPRVPCVPGVCPGCPGVFLPVSVSRLPPVFLNKYM